ncbi:MAG: cell division protein FtsQ/DivIB [Halopseudomonas sp.]
MSAVTQPASSLLRLIRDPYQIWQWLQLPLWLVVIGLLVQWGGQWLERPLAQIEISGEFEQLDAKQLEQQLWQQTNSSYALLDLQQFKQMLESQAWVNRVEVQRSWPDRFVVRVREEHPVARWGDEGLVNEQGDIFSPTGEFAEQYQSEFAALPKLSGPEHRSLNLMAQYRDFNQMLRPLGVSLSGLQMEARGAWTLTLDNGIRLIIGRGHAIDKLRRFSQVYGELLVRYADRIVQIDARYTNGLAVTWNEPPVKQKKK